LKTGVEENQFKRKCHLSINKFEAHLQREKLLFNTQIVMIYLSEVEAILQKNEKQS